MVNQLVFAVHSIRVNLLLLAALQLGAKIKLNAA
jgi:hypothetical protein